MSRFRMPNILPYPPAYTLEDHRGAEHALTAPVTVDGCLYYGGQDVAMLDLDFAARRVTLAYFLRTLLPPLGYGFAEHFEQIRIDLETSGAIANGQWTAFSIDPAHSDLTEETVFKHLEEVGRAIVHTATTTAGPTATKNDCTTTFRCNSKAAPHSLLRDSTSKPDGYFRFHVPSVPAYAMDPTYVYWEDLVAFGEQKKLRKDASINDNIEKLMWSFNQAMRDSPRRRFIFGYTIENCDMHLWFCSRQDLIVSKSFNFMTDHKTLIHFFLSLQFASAAQLGFDPTITSFWPPGRNPERQYDITVRIANGDGSHEDTVFRTEAVISNIGADAIRGRGTRVWKVKKLVDNVMVGESMALKDCWIDHDRNREGSILKEIRIAAPTPAHTELFNRHLLTVECHGDVYVDGQLDNTKKLLRQNTDIPTDLGWYLLQRPRPKDGKVEKRPVGSAAKTQHITEAKDAIEYDEKTHYRIVYKEVGTPIDELKSSREIFPRVSEILKVLQALHESGWVHRDVSAANILCLQDRGAILTDFEYAQEINSPSAGHCGRTGTPYFTPVEVFYEEYLFRPVPAPEPDSEDDTSDEKPATPPVLEAPLRYNPLHDLEAFWWLCVYLLIMREVMIWVAGVEIVANNPKQKELEKFRKATFNDPGVRRNTIAGSNKFSTGVGYLHPQAQDIGRALEQFRRRLFAAYEKAEKDVKTIDKDVATRLYASFAKLLDKVCQKLSVNDVTLSSIHTNMVVDLPQPRPHPPGISYDTGAALNAPNAPKNQLQDGHITDDVFGPLPARTSRLAGRPLTETADAPQAKRTKVTPAIDTDYELQFPLRDSAARLSTPSEDGDSVGGPSLKLAAAGSMMSVTTTVGDISSVPVDEAASLSISGPATGEAEAHASSSGAGQKTNSARPLKPRAAAKVSKRGKGKQKATSVEHTRRSSRIAKSEDV